MLVLRVLAAPVLALPCACGMFDEFTVFGSHNEQTYPNADHVYDSSGWTGGVALTTHIGTQRKAREAQIRTASAIERLAPPPPPPEPAADPLSGTAWAAIGTGVAGLLAGLVKLVQAKLAKGAQSDEPRP